jgi:methionine-rich copper-binding protein CopC
MLASTSLTRWIRATGFAPAILLSGVAGATAHAILERAEPPLRAVLRAPPSEVRLFFSEPIEPAFSRAQVVNQRTGQRVDAGTTRIDPENRKLLSIPLRQPLTAASYKVTWRVVSVDTHVEEGHYGFILLSPVSGEPSSK